MSVRLRVGDQEVPAGRVVLAGQVRGHDDGRWPGRSTTVFWWVYSNEDDDHVTCDPMGPEVVVGGCCSGCAPGGPGSPVHGPRRARPSRRDRARRLASANSYIVTSMLCLAWPISRYSGAKPATGSVTRATDRPPCFAAWCAPCGARLAVRRPCGAAALWCAAACAAALGARSASWSLQPVTAIGRDGNGGGQPGTVRRETLDAARAGHLRSGSGLTARASLGVNYPPTAFHARARTAAHGPSPAAMTTREDEHSARGHRRRSPARRGRPPPRSRTRPAPGRAAG